MTFSRCRNHHHRRRYRILIHHWRFPDSIDQQTNLDHIERFRFCLNVNSGFEIDILLSYPSERRHRRVADLKAVIPALFKALTISSQLSNRWQIRIPISWRSSLGFGTAVGPIWTNSFFYLWDDTPRGSYLDSYFVLTLVSFSQHMNNVFYASDKSVTLANDHIQRL